MTWLWIAAGLLIATLIVVYVRGRRQRAALATFRTHFPHIARLRLVAACPGLEGVLQEAELRMLFDWIMLQLYGRTQTSGFGELMTWTIDHGESESLQLVAEVTRDAVDHLSASVLEVIDSCEGRTVVGVILDQALGESGRRSTPEKKTA